MAFPYIVSAGEETMESSLFSEFTEACVDDFKVANVAFSESCTVEGENFLKLADLHSVHVSYLWYCCMEFDRLCEDLMHFFSLLLDYLLNFLVNNVQDHLRLRAEKSLKGQADLIVVCYGDTQSMKQPKQPRPESK